MQEAWVELRVKDFPVEAGKDYRVYVSLDSYVACVGIAVGIAHAYIDFFNRASHKRDDGGKILPLHPNALACGISPKGGTHPFSSGQVLSNLGKDI